MELVLRRIAISYRRKDSASMAGRIYGDLSRHFAAGDVFMDVDGIPFGEDFRDSVEDALKQAVVLVIVIGPAWLGPKDGGRYRIQDETDPVRRELETAMRQRIHMIPALVEEAAMPDPADLPDSLRDLAFKNALKIDSGLDYHIHLGRLIQSLEGRLASAEATGAQTQRDAQAAEEERKRADAAAAEAARERVHLSAIADALARHQERTKQLLLDHYADDAKKAEAAASRPVVNASRAPEPTDKWPEWAQYAVGCPFVAIAALTILAGAWYVLHGIGVIH